MIEVSVSASSNVGLRRSNNEDMALVGDHYVRDGSVHARYTLGDFSRLSLAVADGIGGNNGGEVASEETLHLLHRHIFESPMFMDSPSLHRGLRRWLRQTNKALERKGCQDIACHNMGTTLTSILFYEGNALWANCGDSRIYRLRSGILTQLTTDHSLYLLTHRPQDRHVITNCLGGGSGRSYLTIEDMTDCVFDSDQFLLCSDGLTDMVTDEAIEQILNDGGDADSLVEAALKAGGVDNVTVCLAKIHFL